jgi:hypothetical protein
VVLLAIVAAVLSYYLTLAGVVIIAFFAGLALFFLLRYIAKIVGIDTEKLERKDWLGYGSTYFFAWLAFWVLVMNVPFSDVTPPSLVMFVDNSQVTTDLIQVSSVMVNITAKATDNAGISVVLIQTTGMTIPVNMTPQGGDTWTYQVSVTSTLDVTVIAEDINGHSTSMAVRLMKSP